MPITSKVHPVFHVSLLKESHSQATSTEFPSEWLTDCPTPSPIPDRILQQRQLGNAKQLLIQWKQQPTSEATWEDSNDIALRFPTFYNGHEDESGLEREGIGGVLIRHYNPGSTHSHPGPDHHQERPDIRKLLQIVLLALSFLGDSPSQIGCLDHL
ncbi:reverse transcriptase, partial [Tanacetum coccineum]